MMDASLQAFAAVLKKDDLHIELARACLMIAQGAYPGLDVERYMGEIEALALRLRARLKDAGGVEEKSDSGGTVVVARLNPESRARTGELVELCWKLGEDAVGSWHRIGEGFAGRRPL